MDLGVEPSERRPRERPPEGLSRSKRPMNPEELGKRLRNTFERAPRGSYQGLILTPGQGIWSGNEGNEAEVCGANGAETFGKRRKTDGNELS